MESNEGSPPYRRRDARQLTRSIIAAALDELDPVQRRVAPEDFADFARARLWIVNKGGAGVKFFVNPVQKRYLAWKRSVVERGRPPRYLVLKYRRGGITTLEQGLSYQMVTSRRNAQVLTLAHTKDQTLRIFRIARNMWDRDDPKPRLAGSGLGSKSELSLKDFGSSFIIATAGGAGVSRGDTLQRVHGSEVSRWFAKRRDQVTGQEELLAAITEATSHGEIVLETTPFGMDLFHGLYSEAKQGRGPWSALFLRWFDDPDNILGPGQFDDCEVKETLTDEEAELIARHGVTRAQIAWRRMKMADAAIRRLFPQEYPEDDTTCFMRAEGSFFDADDLKILMDATPEYSCVNMAGGYMIEWDKPRSGRQYVAGGDTSEGLSGGDFGGIGIVDMITGAQVAALHGRFRPDELARRAVEMCRRYNNALLAWERNNHGHAVIQKSVDLGYGHWLYEGEDGRPGWSTTGVTRPIMLNTAYEMVRAAAEAVKIGLAPIIRDRDFIGECFTFSVQSRGKVEASAGKHDDTVTKWSIAWQVRQTSVKLQVPRGTRGGALRPSGRNGQVEY
jgi:hypothetical protein